MSFFGLVKYDRNAVGCALVGQEGRYNFHDPIRFRLAVHAQLKAFKPANQAEHGVGDDCAMNNPNGASLAVLGRMKHGGQ